MIWSRIIPPVYRLPLFWKFLQCSAGEIMNLTQLSDLLKHNKGRPSQKLIDFRGKKRKVWMKWSIKHCLMFGKLRFVVEIKHETEPKKKMTKKINKRNKTSVALFERLRRWWWRSNNRKINPPPPALSPTFTRRANKMASSLPGIDGDLCVCVDGRRKAVVRVADPCSILISLF